jgi:hypothetical protein
LVLNWFSSPPALAARLPQQVVRITGRIPKEIPILLIGSDLDGKVFSEPTNTVLLSLHGAGIVSHHKLSPEQELILRCPDRNSETAVRIVGQIGASNGIYTYGLAFVDPNLNFWSLEFPPLTPAEIEAGLLPLVCSSCKTIEKLENSGIEADMFAVNKSLLRFCKHCGFSTIWKKPPEVPDPEATSFSAIPAPRTPSAYSSPFSVPVQASLQAPSTTPSQPTIYREPARAVLTLPAPARDPDFPRVDRRKYPRAKVNYSACVRHPERGDEIVTCEDMSRGGLRFRSKKKYYERSLIEIAVPYVHGQSPIFVPAQIVSAMEVPGEEFFRYGVAYLKSPKPNHHF